MNLSEMAVSVVKTKVENTTEDMSVEDFVVYALAKLSQVAKSDDKESAKLEIAAIQKASAIARAKTREMQAALNQGDGKPLGVPVQAVVIQSDAQQSYSEPALTPQPPAPSASVQNPAALGSVGAAPQTNGSSEVPSQPTPAAAPVVNPEALGSVSQASTAEVSPSQGSDSKAVSAVVMNPDALNSVSKGNEPAPSEPASEDTNPLDPQSWAGKGFSTPVNE